MPRYLRIPASLAAILILTACQDVDGRYVVEIGEVAIVTSDSQLCQGDITHIEQTIDRFEDILDTTVREPIPIFIHSRFADVITGCGSNVAGCFNNDEEVHTLWQALEHEIVHAVAFPLGSSSFFWDEGIAVALSGRTRQGETDVSANFDLERGESLDYPTAGHFTRWLVEERGHEGLRALARKQPLSDAYGIELVEAIQGYEDDAPWSYPSMDPCRGMALSPTGPDTWDVEVIIDCTEPSSTSRRSLGAGATRTIDIEQSGTYSLYLDGGHGVSIVACQLDVIDEPPDGDFAGDIIREEAGLKPPSGFASGQEHQIDLEPGRLLLYLSTDEGVTEEEIGVHLHRIGA